MSEKKSFEASMLRLSEIVTLLERNETDLEKTITLFEEGLHLVQTCDGQLKDFEDKVQSLMKQFVSEEKND